jgi:hypothetical protein
MSNGLVFLKKGYDKRILLVRKGKRLMTKMEDKSQSSKVKTELFYAMNKFLVLRCGFYF